MLSPHKHSLVAGQIRAAITREKKFGSASASQSEQVKSAARVKDLVERLADHLKRPSGYSD